MEISNLNHFLNDVNGTVSRTVCYGAVYSNTLITVLLFMVTGQVLDAQELREAISFLDPNKTGTVGYDVIRKYIVGTDDEENN